MKKLTEYDSAHAALIDLCSGLVDDIDSLSQAELVDTADVPAPFRDLLVHDEHMTVRLGNHYGSPVELRVLREVRDDHQYRREILLTLSGRETVVELGVVRIDFRYTDDAIRDEILAQQTPLGEILVQHNVLRRVEPHWYFRFTAESSVASAFGNGVSGAVYGRVGTIYCDEQPAIELLEVVAG